METQKTLTGESQNKDVGKSFAGSKINGRIESYKKIIGSARGIPRPEILPFRESYGEINNLNQIGQVGEKDNMGQRVYDVEGIATSVRSEGGGQGAKTGLYCVSPVTTENAHGTGFHVVKQQIETIQKITGKIRRLTPTECERLQGFPDNWTEGFSDTQRYKMMGNAVTVNVIRAIGEKLKGGWNKNGKTTIEN